ncbi:PD-(D/E)XK nuclease superfamily protein [Caballeronia calidae]|uniref:PD-(D/E)XK nuclease superfamily protein n=1 Tax=Caballeronia calidae TaxID=1777139 RepID=A0A158EI38_9BURK|nr:PD-(D/E)XK nuclease family protein [Caballeronia calidae]SAL05557.1 PD-(D/E)XK nuclease superfamily protein [Caballeronia calidae]
MARNTLIVPDALAARTARLAAAREQRHGLQIMTIEQAVARLAGGFARPIDFAALRGALKAALPVTRIGELESIKSLPGMIDAAAQTLQKAWHAGIDLAARAHAHARIDAVAKLESAVLAQLPPGMMRPADLVAAAMRRIAHASAVLGNVEVAGQTDLAPCWRPLLLAVAKHVPVRWSAGPRATPAWLEGREIAISPAAPAKPAITAVSAATPLHEAIEAMRWARELLSSGQAMPSEIAIASTSTAEYDDFLLSLSADTNLDLHFVHGVRSVATREGQAAAALAEIVVRGLSQSRLRRLAALCKDAPLLGALPKGWLRIMPPDASLSSPDAWKRLLARVKAEHWPDGMDHGAAVLALVERLFGGVDAAREIGEAMLQGRALAIWREALLAGPAASIDGTLEGARRGDQREASVSVAWMPASALAGSPRRHVRLLGLNASQWPRGNAEDPLIPEHIIPAAEFNPLPVSAADRRDFDTILATTAGQVVLSRARRNGDGRLLARSPLSKAFGAETFLGRHRAPVHAFSETDRLMARPSEFREAPQAISARACWTDWRRADITAHDGLVRAGHPLVAEVLGRPQSASSLKHLLRNPLGFLWIQALGWQERTSSAEPLMLDHRDTGNLVHAVLDVALRDLESAQGLARSDAAAVAAAVDRAAKTVASEWEDARSLPPDIIWRRALDEAREMACAGLNWRGHALPGARAYGEVPFGGAAPKSDGTLPWDAQAPVAIPDTGFSIKGYIDRLDISGDGTRASVRDYKTGRTPKEDIRISGGSELQRCLYAFAVKVLLGDEVSVSASLFYPRDASNLVLDDADIVLGELAGWLKAARTSFAAGAALPGPDAASKDNDLAFALPANASATYCKRKAQAAASRLADFAAVWEAQ